MNPGDAIVVAVAALRVALDEVVPLAFTVTFEGEIVCDPGLLTLGTAPSDALSPKARRLLAAATRLIALAPEEVCAVLMNERRPHVSEDRIKRRVVSTGEMNPDALLSLRGYGKTARPQTHREEEGGMMAVLDRIHRDGDNEEPEEPEFDSVTRLIPTLPDEIAAVVLENIPTLARLRLRLVSKRWEAKMLSTVRRISNELLSVIPKALMTQMTQVRVISTHSLTDSESDKLNAFFVEGAGVSEHGLQMIVLGEIRNQKVSVTPTGLIARLHTMTNLTSLMLNPAGFEHPAEPMSGDTLKRLSDALQHHLPHLQTAALPMLVAPTFKYPENLRSLGAIIDSGVPPEYLAPMVNLRSLLLQFDPADDESAGHAPVVLRHLRAPNLSNVVLSNVPTDLFEYPGIVDAVARIRNLGLRALRRENYPRRRLRVHQTARSAGQIAKLDALRSLAVLVDELPETFTRLVTLDRLELAIFANAHPPLLPTLNAITASLPKLSTFSFGSQTSMILDMRGVTWRFRNLYEIYLTRVTLDINVLSGAISQLSKMTLLQCHVTADQPFQALPASLTHLCIEKCPIETGQHLQPPSSLDTLVITETRDSLRQGHPFRLFNPKRALPKGVLAEFRSLRYFQYDVVTENVMQTLQDGLQYYGTDLDLARIPTVLVGPTKVPWGGAV